MALEKVNHPDERVFRNPRQPGVGFVARLKSYPNVSIQGLEPR